MDHSALADLKQMLAAPDVLDELAAAAAHAGEWRNWTFERQVWYLRKHMGMTQAELARRSGVSQHRISRIEAGDDVKISTLRALWRGLGWAPLVIPDTLDRPLEARMPRRDGEK